MRRLFTLVSIYLTSLTFQPLYAQVEWKDVASIFYDNCTTCHRPGEIGSDFLNATGYSNLVNSAYFYSIPSAIGSNNMPPWKADPDYRHFLDERVLSTNEKELISQWINAEAPAGDTLLAPPPPVFVPGSQLGIPDKVLTMAEPFTIPGNDSDYYMCFVLPTNFLNNQNVAAIEFRPGNASVVHHSFIYLSNDSSAYEADLATPEYGYPSFGGLGSGVSADFLTLYAPGMTPRYYPPGSGIAFPANSFLVVQIHYAPISYTDYDQSSINLFYSQEPEVRNVIAKKIGEGYITNPPFYIFANERDTFYMEYPIVKDYSLFAVAPHQHLLGESFLMFAITPQNDTIPIIHIPDWDFHWQLLYSYPFMVKLPQGSKVHARVSYDNTIYNEDNPNNPPQDVHYGESSEDEMCKFLLNMLEYEPGDEDLVLDSNWIATGVPPVNGLIYTPQLYACSPNPAQSFTIVPYFLPKKEDVVFCVSDVWGRILLQVNGESSPGFNQVQLNVEKLAGGMYFITMKTPSKNLSKQMIIQR